MKISSKRSKLMDIEFINNAYTSDGLRLPMVHFESNKQDICVICMGKITSKKRYRIYL